MPRVRWQPHSASAPQPAAEMYRLDEFGDMVADKARFEAYADAVGRAVRPGDVVVDLGCGPGIFALLACRAGAKRVYAIDGGDVIHLARRLAAANGFTDRIEFLHGDSRQIELPERADVVVSDVRGALPFFNDALPSIEDARVRFLKDGGAQIPQCDVLYAAIVEAPEYYNRISSPWKDPGRDIDLSTPLSLILNGVYKVRSKREQLLTEPHNWCTLDYTAHLNTRASAKMHFRATRNGVGHGVTAWFEAKLFENIGFSSGPGPVSTVYGQGFLPWLEPVPLEAGQQIEVDLHADPVGGDYIWRWETKIPAYSGQPERIFRQSTFEGAQFMSETLRRHAVDYVPHLTEAGLAEHWLLQAMNGVAPLQEIAQAAAEKFPNVFRRQEDAFRRVSTLAERFSR